MRSRDHAPGAHLAPPPLPSATSRAQHPWAGAAAVRRLASISAPNFLMMHSSVTSPSPSESSHPSRAPAIYCEAAGPGGTRAHFRLPCPPVWDDRPPAAWAAERRARRAYFAALDGLRTGRRSDEDERKLVRLLGEVRSIVVRGQLHHLRHVLRYAAEAAGRPTLLPPARAYTAITLTVPLPRNGSRPEQLEVRFQWTLDWLRARGYLAPRDVRIDWRVQAQAMTPAFAQYAIAAGDPPPAERRAIA